MDALTTPPLLQALAAPDHILPLVVVPFVGNVIQGALTLGVMILHALSVLLVSLRNRLDKAFALIVIPKLRIVAEQVQECVFLVLFLMLPWRVFLAIVVHTTIIGYAHFAKQANITFSSVLRHVPIVLLVNGRMKLVPQTIPVVSVHKELWPQAKVQLTARCVIRVSLLRSA